MTNIYSAIVQLLQPLFGGISTNIPDLIALFCCLFVILVPFIILYKVLDFIR